ncbi:MAG: hypothetical protein WD708_09390, partial [Kiritimatiellia bacterium]
RNSSVFIVEFLTFIQKNGKCPDKIARSFPIFLNKLRGFMGCGTLTTRCAGEHGEVTELAKPKAWAGRPWKECREPRNSPRFAASPSDIPWLGYFRNEIGRGSANRGVFRGSPNSAAICMAP